MLNSFTKQITFGNMINLLKCLIMFFFHLLDDNSKIETYKYILYKNYVLHNARILRRRSDNFSFIYEH